MWKHTDGTTDDTYTDGAKFVPSPFWQELDQEAEFIESHALDNKTGERIYSLRVIMRRDVFDYDGPDYEMAAPVIALDTRGARLVFGKDSEKRDGLTVSAEYVLGLHGLQFFERWIAAFYEGNTHIFTSEDQRNLYVTYDTQQMRTAYWGQDPADQHSSLAGGDYEAWVNGDIFTLTTERTFVYDPDGEPDWSQAETIEGPVHGHYGVSWAQQAAEEMLDAEESAHEMHFAALQAHRAEVKAESLRRRIVITLDFNEGVDPDFVGELSGSPVGNIMGDLGYVLAEDPLLADFNIEQKR